MNSKPGLRPEIKFLEPWIDQIDDFLMLYYGFTLWERVPELWEDYEE